MCNKWAIHLNNMPVSLQSGNRSQKPGVKYFYDYTNNPTGNYPLHNIVKTKKITPQKTLIKVP
jgi:hypothetical protein